MQFLILFAVGALIGSAYGDGACFTRRAEDCKKRALSDAASELEMDICNYQTKLFRCLADAATECDLKFQTSAKKVADTIESLCTKGTPLAREFNQHKKCLVKAVSETECFKPIVESMINHDAEESRRESCGQVDNVHECVAKNVARQCSKLTETFFRYVTRPIVDMHKGYCDEVVLKNLKRSVPSESLLGLWSLVF